MILRVTKGPQRSQRSRNQSYPTRYNLFLVLPAQCPHKKEENLASFLHSQNQPCHRHWWTLQFQGGKTGKQEGKGSGAARLSGTAVESRPFAQKMPSTSSWPLWRGQRCLEEW